jgi:hypothetical protein
VTSTATREKTAPLTGAAGLLTRTQTSSTDRCSTSRPRASSASHGVEQLARRTFDDGPRGVEDRRVDDGSRTLERTRRRAVAERRAILIHPADDVAVAVEACRAGDEVVFAGERVTARQEVPFGFKVARRRLEAGQPVRKYGEPIGLASAPIEPGEVVHIHNLGGARGRGDLARQEAIP